MLLQKSFNLNYVSLDIMLHQSSYTIYYYSIAQDKKRGIQHPDWILVHLKLCACNNSHQEPPVCFFIAMDVGGVNKDFPYHSCFASISLKRKSFFFNIANYLLFLDLFVVFTLHLFPAFISLQPINFLYSVKIASFVMWSMHYMITLVIKLLFHFFVVDFLSSCSFSLISGIQSLFQTH